MSIKDRLGALLEKAETLGSGERTYKKGDGYPRVRIRRNGIASVPVEELYRSTKARENLEALQEMMDASFKEQKEQEERDRAGG